MIDGYRRFDVVLRLPDNMRTTQGPQRVDVIYRRVDDEFLDPLMFRPDSALGVPGLMRAWRKGKVAIANAPGTGVADDKVVYAYVPQMIRYYLGEDAILSNVPTWLCFEEQHRKHVLANLDKVVVKPANESGGYGILIGPAASKATREEFVFGQVIHGGDWDPQASFVYGPEQIERLARMGSEVAVVLAERDAPAK